MRGNFSQAIMEMNKDMLLFNPINKTLYIIFVFIQFLEPPFIVSIMTSTPGSQTIISILYSYNYPTSISIFLVSILVFQIIIIILYIWTLSSNLIEINSSQDNSVRKFRAGANKIYSQIIITFLLMQQTILNLPIKAFSLEIIVYSFQKKESLSLLMISIVVIILDVTITVFFNNFLQCSYPLSTIHWSLPIARESFLNEVSMMIFSISLAFPSTYFILPYLFGFSLLVTTSTSLYVQTYFCPKANTMSALNQSGLMATLIVFFISYTVQIVNVPYYVVMFVTFVVALFVLKMQMIQKKRRDVLSSSNNLKSFLDKSKWVWALHQKFMFYNEIKLELLQDYLIEMQATLQSHKKFCSLSDCLCQSKKGDKYDHIIEKLSISQTQDEEVLLQICKKMKIFLIEIGIIQNSNQIFQDSANKNSLINMLLLYQQYVYKKNYLQCLFNLTRNHDCKKCSFSQCFSFFIMREALTLAFQQKQAEQVENTNFDSFLIFEQSLRGYIKIMEKTSSLVSDYWSIILKQDLDLNKFDKLGSKIMVNYMKFLQILDKVRKVCGQVFLIESLSWKLHSEILNFDMEAFHNIEQIKLIMNKQRIDKSNSLQSTENYFDRKNYIVVVGGNPNNFHQVQLVSKQFVQICGINEELLLKSKASIFIPQILASYHEKFLLNYLQRRTNTAGYQIQKSQQWLKLANNCLKPVEVKIMPKVTVEQGIQFIGIFSEISMITLFDFKFEANMVFCILTNVNFKVLHWTENLMNNFKIPSSLLDNELLIHQMIINLPDYLEDNNMYECILDLTQLISQSDEDSGSKHQQGKECQFFVKVLYKEKTLGSDDLLREFDFVIVSARFNENNATISVNDVMIPNFSGENEGKFERMNSQQNHTLQSEEDKFDLSSLSSTVSSSSNDFSQQQHVSDIKSVISFNEFPRSLKIFRLKLLIGFVFFMASSISLLLVNIQSKDAFLNDLIAVNTEKLMKNQFCTLMLAVSMLFGGSNFPIYFDIENLNSGLPNKSFVKFMQYRIDDLVDRLHYSINNFSQYQHDWDQSFVNMVTKERFEIIEITENGNIQYINTTFSQSMKMFMQQADFISNIDEENFIAKTFNIFEVNNLQDYAYQVGRLSGDHKRFVQQIYYIIFDGSYSMLKQMIKIDQAFINQIINSGNGLVKIILAVTLSFCGVSYIIVTYYLPYLFQIENMQLKMLEFSLSTHKAIIEHNIALCSLLKNFLDENQYMAQKKPSKLKTDNPSIQKSQTKMYNAHQTYQTTYDKQESINQLNITTMQDKNKKGSGQFIKDYEGESLHKKTIMKKKMNQKEKMQKIANKRIKNLFEEEKEEQVMSENVNGFPFQDDSDENEEERSENHSKSYSEKHQEKIQTKKKKEETTQDSGNITHLRKIQIKSQVQKKKLLIAIISCLIASVFSGFYLLTYMQSNQLLKTFQQGFYQYDVFYTRIPCVTMSLFFLQKSYMNNESMSNSTENGQRMNGVEEECQSNESKYREIRQNSQGMFEDIQSVLSTMDSDQFCNYFREQNLSLPEVSTDDCNTIGQGILDLGATNFVQVVMTFSKQQRIFFENIPPWQITSKLLEGLFFKMKIFEYSLIYFEYVQQGFRVVQTMAHKGIQQKMNFDFTKVIIIFSIFLSLLVIKQIILQTTFVRQLQNKLTRIRFLLKMIPSREIIRLKQKLGEINMKQL